jgi:hypothetical protein
MLYSDNISANSKTNHYSLNSAMAEKEAEQARLFATKQMKSERKPMVEI